MADITMDASPPPPDDAAAEQARAKAEARRQRILEKSRERMGVVAGERSYEEEKVQVTGGNDDDDEPSKPPSGASRMQAMRRRRFKKNAQAKEAEKEAVVEEKVVVVEETTTTETTTTSDATASKTEELDTVKVSVEEETVVSTATKKKYKGVAKMRREMLKKKEKENAAQAKEAVATTPTTSTVPLLRKQPVAVVPILFHLVAVLLLFLAGLDIGWNQVVYSDVVVHRELTPTTNGIALVNRFTGSKTYSTVQDAFKLQVTQQQDYTGGDEEFVEKEEEYIPNIDPIFQVDLDELTQGGGIFNTLARGAIKCHRLLLYLFYYLPMSVLQTCLKLPQQLLATPPILCIISLVIRQTAKLLFGAKLPEPAAEKKEDVLAMMKQGVMNFLAGMFPTVVTAYDVWTHLRSDMYVILCGVLVGLVYATHYSTYFTGSTEDDKDEL